MIGSMPESNNRINVKIIGFAYKSLSKIIKMSYKIQRICLKKEIRNGKD